MAFFPNRELRPFLFSTESSDSSLVPRNKSDLIFYSELNTKRALSHKMFLAKAGSNQKKKSLNGAVRSLPIHLTSGH